MNSKETNLLSESFAVLTTALGVNNLLEASLTWELNMSKDGLIHSQFKSKP